MAKCHWALIDKEGYKPARIATRWKQLGRASSLYRPSNFVDAIRLLGRGGQGKLGIDGKGTAETACLGQK